VHPCHGARQRARQVRDHDRDAGIEGGLQVVPDGARVADVNALRHGYDERPAAM
jgi:hypothetical protein